MMKVMTNKVRIEYENIDSKFTFYKLKIDYKKELTNLFKMVEKLIDSIKKDKIISIYRYDKKFTIYFLIKKTEEILKLNDIFEEEILEYFKGNRLIKEFGIVNDLDDNTKLNILLNSLTKYEFNGLKFDCLDGKLYEVIKRKKEYLITLQYSFKDYCLNASVVTFKKNYPYNNLRAYYITGNYLVKGINKNCSYIQKGEENTKHSIDFFNAKGIKEIENTKLYRIKEIFKKFNYVYNDICKICFQEEIMKEIKFKDIKESFLKDKALEICRQNRVNIINNVEDVKLLNKIEDYLNKKEIPYTVTNTINKQVFNINIVYSREYYQENNIEDKYIKSKDYVVQNVISKKEEKIEILMCELVHKYEYIKRQIYHHSYDNTLLNKFTFGRVICVNKKYKVIELKVENGRLLFNEHNLEKSNDQKECLFLKENENKIIIELMNKYPITEIGELYQAYLNISKRIDVKKLLVPKIIEYKSQNSNYINELDEIIDICNEYDEISLNSLYYNLQKKLYSKGNENRKKYSDTLKYLNIYLWDHKDEKNIYLKPLWRRGDSNIKKAFEKLKYNYSDELGLQYYSASCQSVNEKQPKGFPFRKIKYKFTEKEILEYIDLLDHNDIRWNANMVVPYVFKYITEYINGNY